MSASGRNLGGVGVVMLTALDSEYRVVKKAKARATQGSEWRDQRSPLRLPLALCPFRNKSGRFLRAPLAQAEDIGAKEALITLHPLVAVGEGHRITPELRPRPGWCGQADAQGA